MLPEARCLGLLQLAANDRHDGRRDAGRWRRPLVVESDGHLVLPLREHRLLHGLLLARAAGGREEEGLGLPRQLAHHRHVDLPGSHVVPRGFEFLVLQLGNGWDIFRPHHRCSGRHLPVRRRTLVAPRVSHLHHLVRRLPQLQLLSRRRRYPTGVLRRLWGEQTRCTDRVSGFVALARAAALACAHSDAFGKTHWGSLLIHMGRLAMEGGDHRGGKL
mmetsp:Transcript_103900/g.270530  ORF Transcript_103900/g.270530 Transcript_103900/m.270530 type:complete len:217 (+) Transcript_103900:450-1100(+)